jgi:putative DNA primase/helicase
MINYKEFGAETNPVRLSEVHMSIRCAKNNEAKAPVFACLRDVDTSRGVRLEDAMAIVGIGDLKRIGGELVGPCPCCGGRDRFAVHPRKGKWNCRGSVGGNDAIGLVMHVTGCTFLEAVQMLVGQPVRQQVRRIEYHNDNQQPADNSDKAAWLWAKRRPISEDTPAARYLRKRGYMGRIPPTLGYLPSYREHPDTMIAAFGFAPEIEPGLIGPPRIVTGVHLTRLTPQGDKAPDTDGKVKSTLGPSMGQPIVLARPSDSLGLAITEGIEDGLSVYLTTGLGIWVAGTAGRMPALARAVPDYIETVTVFAHPDEAGQRCAQQLARALEGRKVEVRMMGALP